MEKPKYSDSEKQGKDDKTYTLEVLVQEQKLKLKRGRKTTI